jgi:hypothetical protein
LCEAFEQLSQQGKAILQTRKTGKGAGDNTTTVQMGGPEKRTAPTAGAGKGI